jgi:hypothetical protein
VRLVGLREGTEKSFTGALSPVLEQRFAAVILDSQELFGAGLKRLLVRDRARLRSCFVDSFDAVLRCSRPTRTSSSRCSTSTLLAWPEPPLPSCCARRFPSLHLIVTTARGNCAEILACLG